MAIKRNGEYFTYFAHFENGEVFPRRLHRLVVRDAKGREFILTGKLLPDALITSSGNGHKGQHTGHILLSKEQPKNRAKADRTRPWPDVGDILHFTIGFTLFVILEYLVNRLSY